MVDCKENDKFDLGVKGLKKRFRNKFFWQQIMSECLSGRSENRNLWHMVVKLKTFIISPEIYYSELRNVVKFFFFFLYSDLLLYSSKFAKTETSVGSSKMAEISAPSC